MINVGFPCYHDFHRGRGEYMYVTRKPGACIIVCKNILKEEERGIEGSLLQKVNSWPPTSLIWSSRVYYYTKAD